MKSGLSGLAMCHMASLSPPSHMLLWLHGTPADNIALIQGRHRRRGVRLRRHVVHPHLGQGSPLDARHAGKKKQEDYHQS